jgi:coenzyme F420-0:L-glutamate ligase/coenzyme F420-1:gamma-L-glutamate ligase
LSPIAVLPVEGLPEIGPGDALGQMIAAGAGLADGDIVVIAQKVVSKAEGRRRSLGDVEPGPRAIELGAALDKDPRLVELILGESERIVRSERVLIVETRSGLICANAGIDSSNVGGDEEVLLLPADPDASARRLRAEIGAASGRRVGVVVSDSFGRPWRVGQTEVAIGCAGIGPIDEWRGRADRDGRELAATEIAVADQLAAAADLVRDKAAGIPAAVVRGRADLVTEEDGPGAKALQRAREEDLFR